METEITSNIFKVTKPKTIKKRVRSGLVRKLIRKETDSRVGENPKLNLSA